MKLALLTLFLAFGGQLFGKEEVLSKAENRDAQVVGITDDENHSPSSVRLIVGRKVIWDNTLSWGYPSSVIISWSPFATKVAIGVRTTKTTSEVHVFDTWEKQKELPIPNITDVTREIIAHSLGRSLLISPIGWADENTLTLLSQGNLVDSITDGDDSKNFKYQTTLQVSSGRILSIICLSSHELDPKTIEQSAAAQPPPADSSK